MTFPIYLIGYMGAGKTTVGRLLAERLGWHFVDLDEAFHEIHGLSPADYIRTYGIDAFRRKEKYVVEDLAELPIEKVVYATGGGYPCWEDNMECLKELGTSFYLRWQPRHLAERLALTDISDRPLLHGKNASEILAVIKPQLEARVPYYEQADYILDAPAREDGSIDGSEDEQLAQMLYNLIQDADD